MNFIYVSIANSRGKTVNLQARGGTPKKIGRGVRPASQNPYPIYHQNLRFSVPYL